MEKPSSEKWPETSMAAVAIRMYRKKTGGTEDDFFRQNRVEMLEWLDAAWDQLNKGEK